MNCSGVGHFSGLRFGEERKAGVDIAKGFFGTKGRGAVEGSVLCEKFLGDCV